MRAQANVGAHKKPFPDVYYERAIVNNGERVYQNITLCHHHTPSSSVIFEAKVLAQMSILIEILV